MQWRYDAMENAKLQLSCTPSIPLIEGPGTEVKLIEGPREEDKSFTLSDFFFHKFKMRLDASTESSPLGRIVGRLLSQKYGGMRKPDQVASTVDGQQHFINRYGPEDFDVILQGAKEYNQKYNDGHHRVLPTALP